MPSGPEGPSASSAARSLPPRGSFSLRRFGSEATLVVGAGALGNVLSYLFHFLLSRKLGPESYGTLVTLMSIAGMLAVLGASMGTVAMQETARMWAAHLDSAVVAFVRATGAVAAVSGVALAVGLASSSFVLGPYLHITSFRLWWLLALYVAIMLAAAYARGAAQGAHRFGIFASSLVGEGITKVAISFGLVAMGLGVEGALGGLIASAGVAFFAVYGPLALAGGRAAPAPVEHLRLGGEALRVLGVTAACSVLLFIDMLFAKHHFSGSVAGYFGAAGTLARTLPYGVGLVALIVMPKAAAARHTSRESLLQVLKATAATAFAVVAAGALVLIVASHPLISITYGSTFTPAASLLRLYALDEALMAMWLIAVSYLLAVAQYRIFILLVAAVVLESTGFALFGSTPLRLLSIAIGANAAILPFAWWFALRTLRDAPQASASPRAETIL